MPNESNICETTHFATVQCLSYFHVHVLLDRQDNSPHFHLGF